MLIFYQQTKFFLQKNKKSYKINFLEKAKDHGDPLDELSRLSILLGGVGDHPGETKKRPSALHFRYEHPRTAPLGSGGALVSWDFLFTVGQYPRIWIKMMEKLFRMGY